MKKIYWRPQGTPFFAYIIIGLFSVCGAMAVEHYQITERSPYYDAQLVASNLAMQAMAMIKQERFNQGDPVNLEADPAGSGLIGVLLSPVTSEAGDLQAKQTTINPNFAAVVVDLLSQAGVKPGDHVAVSVTGSFPALNIAVFSALKTMDLKPTIISSVASSQWGANTPDFLWIDMETLLHQRGLFPFHSVAASIGGRYDKGLEMSEAGRQSILQAIKRNGLPQIASGKLTEDAEQRMRLYLGEGRPRAYINVGGGIASVGTQRWRRQFLKTGLQPSEMPLIKKSNSVVYRFIKEGTPVIQLENVRQLSSRYGLPIAPGMIPPVGEGGVYYQTGYNLWLAGAVLFGIFLGLYVFSRTDLGFQVLQASSHKGGSGPPEPMV
jgi:poly-gamma-glutamate system protein